MEDAWFPASFGLEEICNLCIAEVCMLCVIEVWSIVWFFKTSVVYSLGAGMVIEGWLILSLLKVVCEIVKI